MNTEDNIAKLLEQDKKQTKFCQQCLHEECKVMHNSDVCALCYDGRNCSVQERESRLI